MLDNDATTPSSSFVQNDLSNKRKRKPAGTPDPDAEVVSLSPRTLLESDRYVCEICNQGFQRDQNLQMHRRRHKVPWKLLKRETQEVKKRVYVCPEPSCLHHDPCHALGDLVGIKKHFRRKHSNHKQWVCQRCSKGYAVQSDYKAHLKTCGTRGHSCDCGRVFSRVESFIEHQDACTLRMVQPDQLQALQPACTSRAASSTSPSSEANFHIAPLPSRAIPKTTHEQNNSNAASTSEDVQRKRNLELQLLPSSNASSDENFATNLKLSIGSSSEKGGMNKSNLDKDAIECTIEVTRLKDFASEQLKLAVAEKAYAEQARQETKRQIEMAELEFANAKRIRQQAQAEVEKAHLLRDQATKKISSTIMQITCQSCKNQFQASMSKADETTLATSYMSSATTEGEEE
ncbi:C2H2-like zinc finger protein [Tripterygium wilfordii]|uniref:C2H2-like zinc finger protein n=1 Tax=Tripterygium wilfordii TaxID=458696 RepID=A0A7J7CUT1_TRIWF|nr:zinc finger protein SHOOT GRAVITROPISM 5-like [Tripterygium wilfordii]KAF5737784.1 C2H2-like zinc finger protein [Tripterygium wilfordii]